MNCPSCGSAITFKSRAAYYAVCGSCSTLVMKKDFDVEKVGVLGALQPDDSALQLGTRGTYNKRAFEVVGRIQLQFDAGFWNEWYLSFEDGREGWLGEANGFAGVNFRVAEDTTLPPFRQLRVGLAVTVGGVEFAVRDIQNARCVGGEGELPFAIESGYEAPVVDLATADRAFATIDYSEEPPLLFVGQWTKLSALALKDLRERSAGESVAVQRWSCANCGAALEIKSNATLVVACPYCASIVDARDPQHQLLQKYEHKVKTPKIPLGTRGTLRGLALECIGYLEKQSVIEGEAYPWREYLFWNRLEGYRWLVEYENHWTLLEPCMSMPTDAPGGGVVVLGRRYRHFQRARAEVTYALGEFNWSVRRGESVEGNDYVAPPYLFSAEGSDNEVNWSVGEYIEGSEVWKSFSLPGLPGTPHGIHSAQPSPYLADAPAVRMWGVIFVAIMTLAQVASCSIAKNQPVATKQFGVMGADADAVYTIENLELKGQKSNVELRFQTNLDNQWAFVEGVLVSPDHEDVIEFGEDIEFYSGHDSDGAWEEGARSDTLLIGSVPAGRWSLQLGVQTPAPAMRLDVEVIRDVPRFAFYFWAMILLCLPWFIFELLRYRFEAVRWMESDHGST